MMKCNSTKRLNIARAIKRQFLLCTIRIVGNNDETELVNNSNCGNRTIGQPRHMCEKEVKNTDEKKTGKLSNI
jgi:hypothetical protein